MSDIQPYLQIIADRFTKPDVQEALKGFTKTILFTFSDTGESWLIKVNDGKEAALSRELIEQPDIRVTSSTEILAGILDGKINAVTSYLQRRIQVKGAMEDLLRMQKIMK
jgi:predicted lipid carrier protein YhbT